MSETETTTGEIQQIADGRKFRIICDGVLEKVGRKVNDQRIDPIFMVVLVEQFIISPEMGQVRAQQYQIACVEIVNAVAYKSLAKTPHNINYFIFGMEVPWKREMLKIVPLHCY